MIYYCSIINKHLRSEQIQEAIDLKDDNINNQRSKLHVYDLTNLYCTSN